MSKLQRSSVSFGGRARRASSGTAPPRSRPEEHGWSCHAPRRSLTGRVGWCGGPAVQPSARQRHAALRHPSQGSSGPPSEAAARVRLLRDAFHVREAPFHHPGTVENNQSPCHMDCHTACMLRVEFFLYISV
uniref:Uncharacterized protein n=1 Tax=Ananas comosus var. bracteatus TaxID=296719 RepID=A0A6V7NIJ3_ANACO|nr:unnamed protein product [Ananas comosus var. bracteatus]